MDGIYPTDQKPISARRAWAAILWTSMGSLVVLAIVLSQVAITPEVTVASGARNLRALVPLWLACAGSGLTLSAMWWALRRGVAPEATTRSAMVGVIGFILFFGIAARVMVLVGHSPGLSDDIWRYVYDGRNLAAGINPYLALPAESATSGEPLQVEELGVLRDIEISGVRRSERWPGERAIASRVNNPELHTIYLPVSQLAFLVGGALVDWVAWKPGVPWVNALVFRSLFVVLDVLLIVLLLRVLVRRGRSPWWVALYAWHPLPLVEFAGSGHQDVVGIVLLVGAFAMALGGRDARAREGRIVREAGEVGTPPRDRVWTWTSVLALAALVKPVAAPCAVFLLRGRRGVVWVRSLLVGMLVCGLMLMPLAVVADGKPLSNLLSTAERFTLKWAHFGSMYEPILMLIERATNDPMQAQSEPGRVDLWTNDEQEQLVRALCMLLLAIVSLGIWRYVRDPAKALMWFLFVAFLLSPTGHPWYLLWAFALWVCAPSVTVWIASFTTLLGYAAWGYVMRDGSLAWGTAWWVMLPAYLPVYVALVWEVWHGRNGREHDEMGRDSALQHVSKRE